jgi:hypothetical protein
LIDQSNMGRNFLSSKRIQGGAKKTSGADLRAAERIFAQAGFRGISDPNYFPGFQPVPAVDRLFLRGKARALQRNQTADDSPFDAFGPTPSGDLGDRRVRSIL